MNELIEEILAESGYRSNPYFSALRSGEMTKDEFVETQILFYFAVVFFSRPMAALAAKIPTPELRLQVLRNVWEEHGEGDAARVHGHTFLSFLDRLASLGPDEVERRALWPEVRLFNTALVGACVLDDYLVGAAMLGMIERMFQDISSWIGRAAVARDWLAAERMVHYDLHEQIDVRHAQDFFEILALAWGHSPANGYAIEQGLRLGATAFHSLYEGLYRHRKRRLFRAVRGPHSLVDFPT